MNEAINSELVQVLIKAAISILVVLIPLSASMLTRMLLTKMRKYSRESGALTQKQVWMITELADKAIKAAEQMYTSNPEKLSYALIFLLNVAKDNSIPITEQQARTIIEGSIRETKKQLSYFDAVENGVPQNGPNYNVPTT